MYIFRWLMKHPLIILAVYLLGVAAVLYSMTGGNSADSEIAATSSKKIEPDAASIEPSALTSALVKGKSPETDKTSLEEVEVKEEAVKEVTSETVEVTESEETNASAYFKEHGVDPSLNKPTALTADTENKSIEINDSEFSEMNEAELLLMAREAYWNNGLDESAQIYKQLIELNSEVVDYKGELGNVFWRQGFPKKAAELYAEISLPMIKNGNADRVANMVGFIGLYFPEKATEIHNVLQESK